MTHTRAKGQGQRSLGSKVRVEKDGWTDGRTEAIALGPTSRANAIKRTTLSMSPLRLYSLRIQWDCSVTTAIIIYCTYRHYD